MKSKEFSYSDKRFCRKVFGDLDGNNLNSYVFIKKLYKNKKMVGIAGVTLRYGVLPSFFIGLDENYRNSGYGQKLLRQVLDSFKHRPLFLTVHKNNPAAIHIYKKNGFKKVFIWKKKKYLMALF